jgi:hypothetical protein
MHKFATKNSALQPQSSQGQFFSTETRVKPPTPKKSSNPHIPKGKKIGEIDL